MVKSYQQLVAWQKAMDLVVAVYKVTENFPQREVYGLTNQMRRAAVSIPSNIAEGQGRNTAKDFCNFLSIALGSIQELETQMTLSHRLGFLAEAELLPLMEHVGEVGRITNGLLTSLRQKD